MEKNRFMKLYYIANIRIPTEKAHGLQIIKMCEAFALNGVDVELIVPRRLNKIKTDSFDFYNAKRVFKIKKLPCLNLISLDFILGGAAFWIQCASFLLTAKIFLFFQKPGIVYTREDLIGLFFRDFYLEIHSLSKKNRFWQKKSWRRAAALLVLTNFIKEALSRRGVMADKIMVAPDGVDVEQFDVAISKEEARQAKNLSLDKKIIMYSGSLCLYDWKGADVFLEAAKLFGDNVLFVLVGGMAKEIERIKQKYNLSNIELIGHRPNKEIALFLKAADILVLPNKSGEEISEKYTSPLKLFEYMAAKRPIVSSDLPSLREILNESNSVLVVPGSPKELAAGIERLLADLDFGDKISQRAFFEVEQKYTWEKRAKNIIDFIKIFAC
jgi:glycosyltransferase involved in cell wall biosynthesis